MEIRPIAPEDIPAYQHIITHSFSRGTPSAFTAEILNATDRVRYGVFERGRLQATLGILDFRMFFGEAVRPCGGIFGVTCDPAMRGRGFAGALLNHALRAMRERGQYLSSLWPFDFRYYRGFGWDWTGQARHYTVPVSFLRADQESRHVEAVYEDFASRLNPIYEAVARRCHGALVRTQEMWSSHTGIQEGRAAAVYVYRRDGRDEGCVIVRYTDKPDDGRACELHALSARAYRGLLALVRHYSMSIRTLHWDGPDDDAFWSLDFDWPVETRLKPCGMGRVVDARAALEALSPEQDVRGRVFVEVVDEHAPWNQGTWRVEAEDGCVCVAPTDAEAQVRLDMQALTQAYWGAPSLAELRRRERVQASDDEAFRLLTRLLPPRVAWLSDDF